MISFGEADATFRYDPSTGHLWWRVSDKGRRMYRPAGRTSTNRYVTVGFNRKQYAVHHIIWLLQTGKWPESELDHRDTNRTNNRWENLRLATRSNNKANTPLRANSTSGYKGVSIFRKKWRARITVNRKEHHLGVFASKSKAHVAYTKAAKHYFGEFARAL